MRRKLVLLFFSLVTAVALPTGVMAQSKALADVNESCGYDVITDCTGCHYGDISPTWEQTTYLTDGACAFCSEVTSCSSAPPTEADLLADARSTTNAYFETLFRNFMKSMKETGMMNPDGSINNPNIFAEVFPRCPELGPIIASDFSRSTGYLVRRVTERTRNSRNTPDDWELEQLNKFEEMAANGDARTQFNITKPDGSILPTKEFESFAMVTEGKGKDTQNYFRYMRSITMPGMPNEPPFLPCLKCHGTLDQLGPGVADAVQAAYPHDLSMGYKKGDIRGAWTIKIPIEFKLRGH
ncbi:MAG: DUF3365 domain-containing protein [Gammaproteobacteria bacterium]|nr:DUF3365 domain-containing protein [Gammaproteobacteria bacterium]